MESALSNWRKCEQCERFFEPRSVVQELCENCLRKKHIYWEQQRRVKEL